MTKASELSCNGESVGLLVRVTDEEVKSMGCDAITAGQGKASCLLPSEEEDARNFYQQLTCACYPSKTVSSFSFKRVISLVVVPELAVFYFSSFSSFIGLLSSALCFIDVPYNISWILKGLGILFNYVPFSVQRSTKNNVNLPSY